MPPPADPTLDPLGRSRPSSGPASTVRSDVVTDPAPGTPRRAPGRAKALATLVGSCALALVVTLALASSWAEDLPHTWEFAIQREPFGDRSLLRPAAARDALDRVLPLVPARARVVSVRIEPEEMVVHVRGADGLRSWFATRLDGTTYGNRTDLQEHWRGVAPARVEALDLVGPLRAARTRWAALGRPDPPVLRLTAIDGTLRSWTISFSTVSVEDREIEVDLRGRSR